MKKFLSKKSVVALSVVAALVVAVAAYAYWTSAGSGVSGDGTVGSEPANQITLHGSTFSLPNLDATGTITLTADNASSSSVRVTHVSVDSVTADAGHLACNSTDHANWFNLNGADENTTVAANTDGASLPNSVSVKLNDIGDENQDICQGATLTAHLSSTSV